MRLTKIFLRSVTSRTPTPEYAILLGKVLEKFYEDYVDGELLVAEFTHLMEMEESFSADDIRVWS